jgi:hypothetical protein
MWVPDAAGLALKNRFAIVDVAASEDELEVSKLTEPPPAPFVLAVNIHPNPGAARSESRLRTPGVQLSATVSAAMSSAPALERSTTIGTRSLPPGRTRTVGRLPAVT